MRNNGIFDPVNHKLTDEELTSSDYLKFMDVLTDVPESVPLKPVTVDKAGVTNQRTYLTINNVDGKGTATVLCDVEMLVELKGHRGIHMSRCIEALFALAAAPHDSLDSFTEKLAKELADKQSSEKVYVNATATYLAARKTKATNRTSFDTMYLKSKTQIVDGNTETTIGVEAFNMTGCPCTETYTKFTVVPQLAEQGFDREQIQKIIDLTISGTHTQRGMAKLYVQKSADTVTHKALYEALNNSCHLIFELLKRPDEHELVVRALKKPQFTEDVVRDIASEFVRVNNKLEGSTQIKVVSTLFDSIHIHDVHTEIETDVGKIKAELND